MLGRIHACAVLFCLFLAAPAVADGLSTAEHPAGLVDISTLTAESDFTVFMRNDVPEEVRLAALRKLWVLMKLPVSCDDLCFTQEPAASGSAQLAIATHPAAAR